MCFPLAGLYFPMHMPFLLAFGLLNLYLHCGYAVPVLERWLPRVYINTSAWHNKHHELSVAHFGEMLTVWDYIMGTHTAAWGQAKRSAQAARVAGGITGLDGWKAA
jgi:sterol desaturase/sphingolipid hydroxylase (fatty acid hydroxylase superfamily)